MEEINKEAFDILKKEYFNTTSKDCNISSYFNQYDIKRNSNVYEVYDNKNNEDFDLSSDEILNLFKNDIIVYIKIDDNVVFENEVLIGKREYQNIIKMKVLTQVNIPKTQEDCAICGKSLIVTGYLKKYKDNNVCKLDNPDCDHYFHCNCLGQWVYEYNNENCPICRRPGDHVKCCFKVNTSFGKKRKVVKISLRSLMADIKFLLK